MNGVGRFLGLSLAVAGWLAVIGVRPAAAIDIQRVTSRGGIEGWLVEDHTNPIIAVNFEFRGGGALDPAGKEGLASMVAGLLDEGAGRWTARPSRRSSRTWRSRCASMRGATPSAGNWRP